jgi:hypothetical protein
MREWTSDDLKLLIEHQIMESSTLEFKATCQLNSRKQRLELLKDLTGIGNSGGGDVLFGIAEEGGVASALQWMTDESLLPKLSDIARSSVRPHLLWEYQMVRSPDHGFVLVISVEPSHLGPYMIDAYGESRFYKRHVQSVDPMTETEVREAYALAIRTQERREDVWSQHELPIQLADGFRRINVSALPLEPLKDLLDPSTIDLEKFYEPGECGKRLLEFAHYPGSMRIWRDGLYSSDGIFPDRNPTTAIRLYRDGAGAISFAVDPSWQALEIARILNAQLGYLSWYWMNIDLRRPVELEVSIDHMDDMPVASNSFLRDPLVADQPVGLTVSRILWRAQIEPRGFPEARERHLILKDFMNRFANACGHRRMDYTFKVGVLLDPSGHPTDYGLHPGMIWNNRWNKQSAWISEDGIVLRTFDSVAVGFVDNGVLSDSDGQTVGLTEFATGRGVPEGFLAANEIENIEVHESARHPSPTGVEILSPTGELSARTLSSILEP